MNTNENNSIAVDQELFIRKRNQYHKAYSEIIARLYWVLDEIQNTSDDYDTYVASVKSELPRNYADIMPYNQYSVSLIRDNYKALEDLVVEAEYVLEQARAEKESKANMAIGNASLSALGTDTLSDLDEVLRMNREEKEQRKADMLQSVSNATDVLHGKTDILSKLFGSTTDDGDNMSGSKGNPNGK